MTIRFMHRLLLSFNIVCWVETWIMLWTSWTGWISFSWSSLKLNPEKSQIIVFGSPEVLNNIEINGTFLDNKCIRFVSNVQKLRILSQQHFVMWLLSEWSCKIMLYVNKKHFQYKTLPGLWTKAYACKLSDFKQTRLL